MYFYVFRCYKYVTVSQYIHKDKDMEKYHGTRKSSQDQIKCTQTRNCVMIWKKLQTRQIALKELLEHHTQMKAFKALESMKLMSYLNKLLSDICFRWMVKLTYHKRWSCYFMKWLWFCAIIERFDRKICCRL